MCPKQNANQLVCSSSLKRLLILSCRAKRHSFSLSGKNFTDSTKQGGIIVSITIFSSCKSTWLETGFFSETKDCLFMLKHAEKINVPSQVTVSKNKLIGFVLEKHFHTP